MLRQIILEILSNPKYFWDLLWIVSIIAKFKVFNIPFYAYKLRNQVIKAILILMSEKPEEGEDWDAFIDRVITNGQKKIQKEWDESFMAAGLLPTPEDREKKKKEREFRKKLRTIIVGLLVGYCMGKTFVWYVSTRKSK